MNLSEFLLARIAEDEAVAEAAAKMAQHHVGEPPVYDWQVVERDYGGIEVWPTGSGDVGNGDSAETEHIARHDPARVLAECEAKRRIVELDRERGIAAYGYEEGHSQGGLDRWDEVLRLLALPYADHPDYDAESS